MFIRFFFLFDAALFSFIFVLIFLVTSLSAGVFACLEVDLKKLVAMSTLSQLGIIISSLGLGHLFFSFFHMVSHALFKSLLFLRCGFLIIIGLGLQDMRFKGNKIFSSRPVILIVVVANLRLCGFPFLSGFFSRDLIIESFISLEYSIFVLLTLFVSCVISVVYSFKIVSLSLCNAMLGFSSTLVSSFTFNSLLMGILFL